MYNEICTKPAPANVCDAPAAPPPSVGDALIRCGAVLGDCQRQASLILQALDGVEIEDPINEPATIHVQALNAVDASILVFHKLEKIREILCG